MRFQYLKHSLQKRMVYHSNQLREAIIKLWQSSYPYFRIVDSINDSAIAQIYANESPWLYQTFQDLETLFLSFPLLLRNGTIQQAAP